MDTITATFETYDDEVKHVQVTGRRDDVLDLARILRDADATFCIRTADGMLCRCRHGDEASFDPVR